MNKIGISGSSAGGHLASYASVCTSRSEIRPAFSILLFPVLSATKEYAHFPSIYNLLGKNPSDRQCAKYDCIQKVTSNAPPTLLICATDDPIVNAMNSIEYCKVMHQNNVPVSLHLLPIKAHGQFYESTEYKDVWKELLLLWLKSNSII